MTDRQIKIIDLSDFPLIRMDLPDITEDVIYNEIEYGMEGFYKHGKEFRLEIETKNVENIHMMYLYKFAKFLKSMKKKDPQYLAFTTIHIYDDLIYNLMYTLFTFLTKPIAPVKLIRWKSREDHQIKKIQHFYP